MNTKATMTLNLANDAMKCLDGLAIKKGISKTAVIREAIRMYQLIESRLDEGKQIKFVDPATGKEDPEIVIVGCGWPGMD